MHILIVGNGVVGKNLRKELDILRPDVYDRYHTEENNARNIKYDAAFICVPAPFIDSAPCDTSEIISALSVHDAKIYVIKSTVLPGTTEELSKRTGKHIVVSPEYRGSTPHSLSYAFNFTILGGDKADCHKVTQILQMCYDGRHRFCLTDARTAELVKYMENTFLATKVSFCAQFWEIAKQIGVDYTELRELFLLDPRINPSHTFIFDNHPYWDSPCLVKDTLAIAEAYQADFLKGIIQFNDKLKAEG